MKNSVSLTMTVYLCLLLLGSSGCIYMMHEPDLSDTNNDSIIPYTTLESIETIEPTSNPKIISPGDLEPNHNPTQDTSIIWSAGFEVYGLSEFHGLGDFTKQGSGAYTITPNISHSGKHSAALSIDTSKSSDTGAHAANLVFWHQLPQEAYYYSAWYHIPANVIPRDWWVIFEFMSTKVDGDLDPVYILDCVAYGRALKLQLVYRPDKYDQKIAYDQDIMLVTTEKWFHIEMYYRRGQENDGQVVVWQDGVEIFNVKNTTTVLSGNEIFWHINNYTDYIQPNPNNIHVDDLIISSFRIGPDYFP